LGRDIKSAVRSLENIQVSDLTKLLDRSELKIGDRGSATAIEVRFWPVATNRGAAKLWSLMEA
jgi:hypothetical protein